MATPIQSAVDMFGTTFVISPLTILAGVSIEVFKKYRPQNYIGWAFIVVGLELLSTLEVESSTAQYVGYQVLLSIGFGIVWISTQFPVLAPLPYSNNTLAFYTFVRCLPRYTENIHFTDMPLKLILQSWGIVIGGAIIQNILASQLPEEYTSRFSGDSQFAYAAIPDIKTLEPELQMKVRKAFAEATRKVWYAMAGISGVGLLSCLLMEEVKMQDVLDETWALKDKSVNSLPDTVPATEQVEKT